MNALQLRTDIDTAIDILHLTKPASLDPIAEQLYYDLAFIQGFSNGELPTQELARIFRRLEAFASPAQVKVRFKWNKHGTIFAHPELLACQTNWFVLLVVAMSVTERLSPLLPNA